MTDKAYNDIGFQVEGNVDLKLEDHNNHFKHLRKFAMGRDWMPDGFDDPFM